MRNFIHSKELYKSKHKKKLKPKIANLPFFRKIFLQYLYFNYFRKKYYSTFSKISTIKREKNIKQWIESRLFKLSFKKKFFSLFQILTFVTRRIVKREIGTELLLLLSQILFLIIVSISFSLLNHLFSFI